MRPVSDTHDHTINLALTEESKNLIGGQSGPDHYLAPETRGAYALSQRFKVLQFNSRSGGIIIVTNARSLRCGHYQRVIGVKEDEIGAKLYGLRKCECKGLFVCGISEAKRMVEGLHQPLSITAAIGTS